VGWGSFPYMAPELWELKSPTIKTDLYALGCMAYELLAGSPPYTGDQAALRAGHLTPNGLALGRFSVIYATPPCVITPKVSSSGVTRCTGASVLDQAVCP
jgi:serine/threonine protein kinase